MIEIIILILMLYVYILSVLISQKYNNLIISYKYNYKRLLNLLFLITTPMYFLYKRVYSFILGILQLGKNNYYY